jgi:hypothetical protein
MLDRAGAAKQADNQVGATEPTLLRADGSVVPLNLGERPSLASMGLARSATTIPTPS